MKLDVLAGTPLHVAMSLKRINCCFQNRKITISFTEVPALPPLPFHFPGSKCCPPFQHSARHSCVLLRCTPGMDVLIFLWAAPCGTEATVGGQRTEWGRGQDRGSGLLGRPVFCRDTSLSLKALICSTEKALSPPRAAGKQTGTVQKEPRAPRQAVQDHDYYYSRSSRSTDIPVLPKCTHFTSARSAPN